MLPLETLEQKIGYTFKNRKLLQRAVTHRSFGAENNERLEFLGDSVLNCVIGQALFLRDAHFNEGSLSRVRANLVCQDALAEIANRIVLSDHLRLGEGEMKTGGAHRPSIQSDAMEAIFGAIMTESGFDAAKAVILRLYEPVLSQLTSERMGKDSKTQLQEFLQAHHIGLPEYSVIDIRGAAHDQTFECECGIKKLSIAVRGVGKNRRTAEQVAAKRALELAIEYFDKKRGHQHD